MQIETTPEMVKEVYAKLKMQSTVYKKTDKRPLTLAEKLLARHLEEKFLDKIKYANKQSTKIENSIMETPKILGKHGIDFNQISFWDFIEQSLVQREKLKFEFTKNLSAALELIASSGSVSYTHLTLPTKA